MNSSFIVSVLDLIEFLFAPNFTVVFVFYFSKFGVFLEAVRYSAILELLCILDILDKYSIYSIVCFRLGNTF